MHCTHQTVCLWISFLCVCVCLQNYLNGKKNFNSLEDCKSHLEKFFAQKDKNLGEGGISKLPEKYQKIVEQSSEDIFFNKVLNENEKCVFLFLL